MSDFWQHLPPPHDVKAALDEFSSWGAVVEYTLFAAPLQVDVRAHQMAAHSGLNTTLQAAKQRAPLWQIAPIDSARLATENARHCTPQQFFGPCYEVETDLLMMRGESAAFLNHYFREGQHETKATAISQLDLASRVSANSNYVTSGYTQALFEPPYPLHNGNRRPIKREVAVAFRRLSTSLFGDLKSLEIYSWPTDCSNYFDAGHEWWGSFFWTVHVPSKNWIVTILASSTD